MLLYDLERLRQRVSLVIFVTVMMTMMMMMMVMMDDEAVRIAVAFRYGLDVTFICSSAVSHVGSSACSRLSI